MRPVQVKQKPFSTEELEAILVPLKVLLEGEVLLQ